MGERTFYIPKILNKKKLFIKRKNNNKTRDESLGFFVYLCNMKFQKKLIPLYLWCLFFVVVICFSFYLQIK